MEKQSQEIIWLPIASVVVFFGKAPLAVCDWLFLTFSGGHSGLGFGLLKQTTNPLELPQTKASSSETDCLLSHKYYRLSGLDNRHWFSPSSGGWKLEQGQPPSENCVYSRTLSWFLVGSLACGNTTPVFTWPSPREPICIQISPTYDIGFGATLVQ